MTLRNISYLLNIANCKGGGGAKMKNEKKLPKLNNSGNQNIHYVLTKKMNSHT